ncbi:hypothetical protein [Microbulbifer taiwanensis]|uniref:hypothetical protein n=1 Tax=Microbulbifer taiwanensis TaxID=986746 RepID=UPI003616286D
MAKLIVFEFLSLDGFMAGPPGSEMDFVVSDFGDDMERDLAEQYGELDAFVMGEPPSAVSPATGPRRRPLASRCNR